MVVLHLENFEWVKINLKQGMTPFIQGACCAVNTSQFSRKIETKNKMLAYAGTLNEPPVEGIFFFGGKNQKGECLNKLRFFKPVAIDGKIVHGEFLPIKVIGNPPPPRFGHTLNYLPSNNSLLVAGGKLTTLFLQFIFSRTHFKRVET